ncbi:MAG: hypothetical protein IPI77_17190 [Saprospiraceae bacterium]|nr:hypothetical protein [Saprospiraceae bacterium]
MRFKFYKQKNGVSTLLAVGSAGALANDPSMARVLLSWQRPGSWTLAADYAGGRSFDEEWPISDPAAICFLTARIVFYPVFIPRRARISFSLTISTWDLHKLT